MKEGIKMFVKGAKVNYEDMNNIKPEEKEMLIRNYSNIEATEKFVNNIDKNRKGAMVPPPPKPGEYIYCQMCGEKMLPEHFSKDEKIRKREFKWHIHEKCFVKVDEILDQMTPGLLAERGHK